MSQAGQMSIANLGLRFGLELACLAGFAILGAHLVDGPIASAFAGLAATLSVAVIWGLFVSPKARIPAPAPVRLAIELGVFAGATAGFAFAGRDRWALAFGATVVFHELWRLAEVRARHGGGRSAPSGG